MYIPFSTKGLNQNAGLGFVCLLFWGVFMSQSRIFHSNGDVTIAGEISTYTWHLGPLSNEGSLALHAYCDTGHPFMIFISEDPWHSNLLLSVRQWSFHHLFLRLRSVAAGIPTPKCSNCMLHLGGEEILFYKHCLIFLIGNADKNCNVHCWFLFLFANISNHYIHIFINFH